MRAVHCNPSRRNLDLIPVALPQLAVARVSGADAGAFLQAQLSADVAALPDGGATFACYCSPRGQVYGLLLVCRLGDEFRLAADRALLPAMLKRLGLFVLRARVELELADGVAVQGCPADPRAQVSDGGFQPANLGLIYHLVTRTPGMVEDSGHWKEQELLKHVVWLDPATSERFIPQMLGLDSIGAVSFSKGCYPGQEIIARARYLGKVKRQPLLLKLFGAPRPASGAPLRLRDGARWLDGIVVDSVAVPGETSTETVTVFAVAPVPEGSVDAATYAGRDYRCATI
jgi:folate-binding protein YgfZ